MAITESIYVEVGTLIVSGTDNFVTHKIGVDSVRKSNFTNSGGAAKLVIGGDLTINDNREWFVIQDSGTLAPGGSVGTLNVDWLRNTGDATNFRFENGSTYLTGLVGGGGGNDFSDWIATFPGAAGDTSFEGDPDGDGIASGLENFFGTNPGGFPEASLRRFDSRGGFPKGGRHFLVLRIRLPISQFRIPNFLSTFNVPSPARSSRPRRTQPW